MRFNEITSFPSITKGAQVVEPLRIQPPELKLPFPLNIWPFRRRIARVILSWARPVIKGLVAWVALYARDLIDQAEGTVDEVVDKLIAQIDERL